VDIAEMLDDDAEVPATVILDYLQVRGTRAGSRLRSLRRGPFDQAVAADLLLGLRRPAVRDQDLTVATSTVVASLVGCRRPLGLSRASVA
jgi:hypothetical protein